LIWNIPEDLQHFKDITKGHIVVMGKNTYISIPKNRFPLKERINIVISSTLHNDNNNTKDVFFITYNEVDETLKYLYSLYQDKKCFIIGGAQLYNSFINKANVLHLTHINKDYDGDVKFPVFNNYAISNYSDIMYSTNEKCNYQFITYNYHEVAVDVGAAAGTEGTAGTSRTLLNTEQTSLSSQ